MGLNWVEDLVSHLYQLRGYLVIQNEDLPMPRTDTRSVRGHSDIDIVAIKDGEVVHIECQSWWGPKKDDQQELNRLKARFDNAPQRLRDRYRFLGGYQFPRVFVTSGKPKRGRGNGPWDRLQQFCTQNQIQLVEINTIVRDLIAELKTRYPKSERVGKEEGIARFLLHLIHNGFLADCQIETDNAPNNGVEPIR